MEAGFIVNTDYTTHTISQKLLDEVSSTLKGLDYGSVELQVVNGHVVQITKRHIRKTRVFTNKTQ